MDSFNYVFPFLSELENPIITPIAVGVETRSGTEYYYDNKERMLNGYLFQYTLRGSGILYVKDKKYELQPGQAFFIPIPSDTRYMCDVNKREKWEFIYILLQSSFMDEYYRLITKKASNILDLSLDSGPIQFLSEICNLTKNGHITNFNSASSIAFDFMNRLYYHYLSNKENHSKRNRQIMYYIDENYATLTGINQLAEIYHISPSHLSRDFTEDTGISPIQYLTRVRIEQAKKLLQTSSMSISEIAKSCGYHQTNYFCKVFREMIGQTPLQYRNCIT